MENKNNNTQAQTPLVNSFNTPNGAIFTRRLLVVLLLAVVLGVSSGYLLRKKPNNIGGLGKAGEGRSPTTSNVIVGSDDLKVFKDTVTGELKVGGINGEGAYHLVRPGGASQNVYLTSSVVDLSQFVGKKIKVWGETQKAKVAGWLMDVGRVEVL